MKPITFVILSAVIMGANVNCGKDDKLVINEFAQNYSKIVARDGDGPTAVAKTDVAGRPKNVTGPTTMPVPVPVSRTSASTSSSSSSGAQEWDLDLESFKACEAATPRGNTNITAYCCRLNMATGKLYRDLNPKANGPDTCMNWNYTCKRFGSDFYDRTWVDNWSYYDNVAKPRIPASALLPEDNWADVKRCLGPRTTDKNGKSIPTYCCIGKVQRDYCVKRNDDYPNPAKYGRENVTREEMQRHGCMVEDELPPTSRG